MVLWCSHLCRNPSKISHPSASLLNILILLVWWQTFLLMASAHSASQDLSAHTLAQTVCDSPVEAEMPASPEGDTCCTGVLPPGHACGPRSQKLPKTT